MDSKDEWENLHRQNRFRPKYPNEVAVQWMFRNFKRDKTEKVLDIGCGAGRHTFMLAKENIIPYGIDISMPGVEYTREILRTNGDFGEYTNNIVCGTFSELPFEDNFFDGAMAYGSLYYSDIAGTNFDIGGFAVFADYFFDGMLADFYVQSKISKAQRQVDEAITRVQDALARIR